MPVSLAPPSRSRRSFLKTTALATAGAVGTARAADPAPEPAPWFALLADTHIDKDPATEARGAVMADNLRRVVAEVLAQPTAPEFVAINGDCAYLRGEAGDYATLRPLVAPLLDAGVPVHLTMGNHDDRGPFFATFPEAETDDRPVETHHLTVIEGELANWFLLDTLQVVNKVTGEIGEAQRAWLGEQLDAHGDKPAILLGHHNPQQVKEGERVSGIADTAAFLELLRAKPNAKAYFFGHTHNYSFKEADGGIHLVNQPPVAYVFNAQRPNGWLRAEVGEGGMSLELNALDRSHAQHAELHEISWKRS